MAVAKKTVNTLLATLRASMKLGPREIVDPGQHAGLGFRPEGPLVAAAGHSAVSAGRR